MRDVRPKGRLEWGHGFCPWGSMENGGVIITDFINLKKEKIDKKLERIQSWSAGGMVKPEPRVVKKLSHF